MPSLLDSVNSPKDLKALLPKNLPDLASEIREQLVSVVSINGGHLASNLGIVELTIALHRIFDSPLDKLIWDVGHQAYTHKLLTGRKKDFATLRQYHGLSGFTCRSESKHDPFGAGHASTSISAALGMAIARDLVQGEYHVIAIIGDGAITGGMALEALNQAGHLGTRLIVILNDNGMSISPTVGAIARMLDRVRFDHRYRRVKERGKRLISNLPWSNKLRWASQQIESGFKGLILPTTLWEELGFAYMGPIDGHNIIELETALTQAKEYRLKPTLIHVVTTKGKGYLPAEGNAVYFHGISAKNAATPAIQSYSEVFAQTTLKLARENPKLVVITPAMPEANYLNIVQAEFPERVFDVGICEQHAVTFAAGLATLGFKPIVAIYSTFLQRAYDQIIHDICLQNLPVVFAIDRSGIVGDDGKTHQGIFDISYLTSVPNLIVSAPKDENELQHMLYTAVRLDKPMAIRYPRGSGRGVALDKNMNEIPVGRGEILRCGRDLAIMAIGSTVYPAIEAAEELASSNIEAKVINARFSKPLDLELITGVADHIKHIITVEENILSGGFGSNVSNALQKADINGIRLKSIGLPDEFIEHGSQDILRAKYGLDAKGIVRQVHALFHSINTDPQLVARGE